MYALTPPRHEGSAVVRDKRKLGYAEFGPASGQTVLWFHGTPGARHQIPEDARVLAEEQGFRVIGIDRPGIGLSSAYLYPSLLDAVPDISLLLEHLEVDRFAVIGLSGGGPYALATAYAMPERVTVAGILGGVAPNVGPESIAGGLVGRLAGTLPVLPWVRLPLSRLARGLIGCVSPLGPQALWLYAQVSPEGDRAVLGRAEIKSMFLDDLMHKSRRWEGGPLDDLILFLRPWGFSVSDISVPVHWWHGDADHIVPFAHGRHVASLIPGAELHVRHGESHLGGLGAAEEVLKALLTY